VELFLTLVGGGFILGIVVVMVRLSIKALGTPADRAAGNQMLQQTAALPADGISTAGRSRGLSGRRSTGWSRASWTAWRTSCS